MAKRATNLLTKKPKPVEAPPGVYISTSVTYADEAARWGTRAKDFDLVNRAVQQTAATANDLLATTCASQIMRLYRPAGKGGKSVRVWPGRVLDHRNPRDRKRLDHLKGYGKQSPGRKALAMASAADEIEEVVDHPVLDLMDQPDVSIGGTAWMWLFHWYQEAAGRTYIYKGERVGGVPVSLYILASQYTRPIASRTSWITGYRYGIESVAERDFGVEDVGYYRRHPSPLRPIEAYTWLQSVVPSTDMEAAAVQAEIARWTRGGSPSQVFLIDPKAGTLTFDKLDQIRAHLQRQYSGAGKHGEFMVTQNAVPQPAAVKPHEMNYIQGQELIEARIYRAASIPEPVWKMNSANRASAAMADPQFMSQAILPRINSAAEFLTNEIVAEFDERMWFAYDNPVAEDRVAEVDECVKLVDVGGMTLAEMRAKLGYDAAEAPELEVYRYHGTPLTSKEEARAAAEAAREAINNGQASNSGEPEAGSGEGDEEKGGEDQPGADNPPGSGMGDDAKALASGDRLRSEEKAADRVHVVADTFCGACCQKADVPPSEAEQRFARELQAWYNRMIQQAVDPTTGAVNLVPYVDELNAIAVRGMREMFMAGAVRPEGEATVRLQAAAESYARQHAASLVTNVSDTFRTQLQNTITQGLGEGKPVAVIQTELAESGLGQTRAEVVVRTEYSFATQGGEYAAAKDAGFNKKEWLLAGGPCPLCEAIAAKYPKPVPLDQPFFEAGDSITGTDGKVYTFNRQVMMATAHPNCVLGDTEILAGSVIAATRAFYRGNVVAIRTKGGRVLTVTENHQLLTRRGWCPAFALKEGDDLVCAGGGERVPSVVNPDVKHRPTLAHEVFDTLRSAGGVTTRSVPLAPEHLHGDGVSVDGQIEVVSPNGLLVRDGDTTLAEHVCKTALKCGDAVLPGLIGDGRLDSMLLALRFAANGCVGGVGQSLSLLGPGVTHSDVHRFAAIALANPRLLERPHDSSTVNAEVIGKTLDRLAEFDVAIDKIGGINVRAYEGHVFDLSTVSGAYVSNGIVSHNCRCSAPTFYEEDAKP